MSRKAITAAFLAVGSGLITAGPVLATAGMPGPTLPGPGVLVLVAAGVIGAIALARSRK